MLFLYEKEENKLKHQTFSGKYYAAGKKFQWLRKGTTTDQIKKSERIVCLAQVQERSEWVQWSRPQSQDGGCSVKIVASSE